MKKVKIDKALELMKKAAEKLGISFRRTVDALEILCDSGAVFAINIDWGAKDLAMELRDSLFHAYQEFWIDEYVQDVVYSNQLNGDEIRQVTEDGDYIFSSLQSLSAQFATIYRGCEAA